MKLRGHEHPWYPARAQDDFAGRILRARGEHVFAGLEQLGGKCVRAMTLARNELAILLKCAAYNAKRLVWLVRHDPCGCAR